MASSAFHPIIYACFVHDFQQMNIEAGANRYLLTIFTYLVAVTIYSVSYLKSRQKWVIKRGQAKNRRQLLDAYP